MFRRLKNLWALSRYTVEELKEQKSEQLFYSTSPDFPITVKPFNPVTIVDLQDKHPFDEYETPEQSPNDSAPRNG